MQALFAQLDARALKLLFSGLLLLMAAALFSYVVSPAVNNFRDVEESLSKLTLLTKNAKQIEASLQVEKNKMDDLEKILHGDMAKLSADQMQAYIIQRLQQISWNNDIELLAVVPNTGETLNIFKEILFEINIVGDYFDIYEWLKELHKELGLVVVKQISIRPLDQDLSKPKLTVNLTIAAHSTRE